MSDMVIIDIDTSQDGKQIISVCDDRFAARAKAALGFIAFGLYLLRPWGAGARMVITGEPMDLAEGVPGA